MSIFDGKERHELEEMIERLEEMLEREMHNNTILIHIVDRLTAVKGQHVKLILLNSSNNQIMAITLNANQFSIDTLGLVDSDTGNAVAATFANVSFVSSDPTIFTSTQDPANPNTTKDVAVAAGSASLNVTADASYTDSVSGLAVTKAGLIISVPVTVAAVVAGENVALTITQGIPTLQ